MCARGTGGWPSLVLMWHTAAAAPYCFLHGVERRRPDGSGRLMAPPKRSFVAAVPHAESEGGRAFVHVLCVPGGDAQRTSWDWACLAVVSARLRPELFEPYLHLLHARWAALSTAQQQLAELDSQGFDPSPSEDTQRRALRQSSTRLNTPADSVQRYHDLTPLEPTAPPPPRIGRATCLQSLPTASRSSMF